MPTLEANSIDAIVTDPPYGLSFMGKAWDHGVPGVPFWVEALRVAKPGAHLLAFGGTRTFHRLACAIEDAGWEIRDCVMWVYGSGFPKSLDVSKAIDKHGGNPPSWFGPWFRAWREDHGITQKQVAALFPSKTGGLTGCVANWELGLNLPTPEQFNRIRDAFGLPFESIEAADREVLSMRQDVGGRTVGIIGKQDASVYAITAPATDEARQWHGWGTALKPAWEPIIVARKPLMGTVAANVLEFGTGAINVDGCRVSPTGERLGGSHVSTKTDGWDRPWKHDEAHIEAQKQRWAEADRKATELGRWPANLIHDGSEEVTDLLGDAARFFYCAKASKRDRDEGLDGEEKPCGLMEDDNYDIKTGSGNSRDTRRKNHHPTVKPTELMRYLCRLVTPPGGLILDPFAGSGSTGKAAALEEFRFIGIEKEAEFAEIARQRIAHVSPDVSTKDNVPTVGQLSLFE